MGVPDTSRDLVESVRSAGDIVRLVSDYVPLRPAGARMKGLCPFHQEKTPSFTVDPQAQLFYCFGCQQGGDIFKFVMLYEKVGFREALETLARRWGVPIPRSAGSDGGLRERILAVNRAADERFRKLLRDPDTGSRARAYLERRGLREEIVEALGLGYAPEAWEGLRTHLLGLRFEPKDLLAAGLVLPRKEGSGEYDRFRDRLIFPIRDVEGRTVAFGGRALGDAEPKYLNSPETGAYVKGDHCYGLDRARAAIRREGFAIVVEGYLDLAALWQAGFDHAIATLGTAMTPQQVRLLSRFTERVTVSYDGDAAGSAATVRSLDLLLERGLEVRAVDLPAGQDPDDFVRASGADAYAALVHEAPGWLEFLVQREARGRDLTRVQEKVAAINGLLPRIARLDSAVERATWAGRLASAFGVEDDLILVELRSALKAARPSIRPRPAAAPSDPVREAEARLVGLLLGSEEAREKGRLAVEPEDLEGSPVAGIVAAVLRRHAEGKEIGYPQVLDDLEGDEEKELLTRLAFRDAGAGEAEEVEACVEALRRRRLKRQGQLLQRTIERAPGEALDDLLMEKIRLARQVDALP